MCAQQNTYVFEKFSQIAKRTRQHIDMHVSRIYNTNTLGKQLAHECAEM